MPTVDRSALVERLTKERDYQASGRRRLWASEAGGCTRKAMLRIGGYQPTHPFPLQAREAMQNGIMFEDDTAAALREVYGERLSQQVYIGNDFWSQITPSSFNARQWARSGETIKAESPTIQIVRRMLYRHLTRSGIPALRKIPPFDLGCLMGVEPTTS